ncbi:unnamed protein product [Brachionus calyciflorus]|uniref:Reverse transcriptase RNase H-like domain-containing protein n=1 Tax=Brachionus calyciflorus TaxID=104777 RepID=A0A814M6U6_9BILA|nr:unnamed protein product [Brachionus calyciflorus]
MDPAKVRAIVDRKPPKNVKQVQLFLGATNYYRVFIKDYASIAHPLYNLLKKDVKFYWGLELDKAFYASGYAMGTILSQIDDNGNDSTERECLIVVWGIKENHKVLYGQTFDVVTDHIALKWLMSIKEPNEYTIPPKEHPAKTLAIKGVFNRIGIDLVFGLPETKEGYIVKGKTAVEIAEKFLRRHCEQNPDDWQKWIPYKNENWSSVGTEFQNDALEERVKEIRYLMEEGYPDALKNIKKSKAKQLETQNKSRTVVDTPIPIGTKVWISIPGLHDKLHPKYRGPYTFIGITKNDNYIVEDALKRKIEDTFPRQRLKIDTNPTNPGESDVYEVWMY